jgi:hypothetical protein
MNAVRVVPAFDVVEDNAPGLLGALELMPVDSFGLSGFEKGLGCGFVPTVSFPGHILDVTHGR